MRRPGTLAIALWTTLVLVLSACGSDDDGDETTTTGGDETTTTVDDEGISPLEDLAQSLLVTVDELGIADFQDAGYNPEQGPNQCGYDLDAEYPAEVLVGTTLGNSQLVFEQEIRVYPTSLEAQVAYASGVDGATCDDLPDGTTFGEQIDLTEQVGGDSATGITVTSPALEGVVVVVLVSDAVVSFTFVGAPGAAEASGAPNPAEVAAFGVGKILAALEQG